MFAKLSLNTAAVSTWLKSEPVLRSIKVAVAAMAVVYLVHGTAVAADYVNAPRAENASSGERVAEAVWVSVAWPVVLLNTLRTDPQQRIGPLPTALEL